MFTLSYDRTHNVLMARFAGVFSSCDLEELDRAVISFTAHEGPSHGLLDFSTLEAVTMPMGKLLRRGQQPPISPGYRRVFVVPGSQGHEFASVFASQQAARGTASVQIVSTLEEAYRLLRLPKGARFEPVG